MMPILTVIGALASAATHGEPADPVKAYVQKDYATALKIWQSQAEYGDPGAQFMLGMMNANGEGVPQDYREAMRWYRLSAERGHWGALHDIGILYANGQGVPQDFARAYMWFNLAAAATGDDDGTRKMLIKSRDQEASRLTAEQVANAQEMARRCQQSRFKDCD